uniref:GTP-binding regulatory protein G42 alpha chain (Fragments) n=1 Tax=Rattus norvegicus TaxID=10116 RepID=Q7M0H6_RAT
LLLLGTGESGKSTFIKYYLNDLDRVADPSYLPTQQDVLRIMYSHLVDYFPEYDGPQREVDVEKVSAFENPYVDAIK